MEDSNRISVKTFFVFTTKNIITIKFLGGFLVLKLKSQRETITMKLWEVVGLQNWPVRMTHALNRK